MNFTSTRRILASTRRRIRFCAGLRLKFRPNPCSVIEARTSTLTGWPPLSTGAVGASVVATAAEGASVVGHALGDALGLSLGDADGDELGDELGDAEGASLGEAVGDDVGASVLSQQAKYDPSTAGQQRPAVYPASAHRGCALHSPAAVGEAVGAREGAAVGACEGACDGRADGAAEGVAVSHTLFAQFPLTQSRPCPHFLPASHGGHAGPPQFVSVSSPLCSPSVHVAADGLAVGSAVGLKLGSFVEGACVGAFVGEFVGSDVGASVFWQQGRYVTPSSCGQHSSPSP